MEEHLADLFGLNDSKYQWAIDRFFEEKKEKEDEAAFEEEVEEEIRQEKEAKLAAETDALEGGAGEGVSLTSEAATASK